MAQTEIVEDVEIREGRPRMARSGRPRMARSGRPRMARSGRLRMACPRFTVLDGRRRKLGWITVLCALAGFRPFGRLRDPQDYRPRRLSIPRFFQKKKKSGHTHTGTGGGCARVRVRVVHSDL